MGKIKVGKIVLGACQTNCYYVYREESKECIFIDPADQGGDIFKALDRNGFQIKAILLTHGHFDHIWGSKELRELSGAPIYALDAEAELLRDSGKNVSAQVGRPYTLEADEWLKDGQILTIAGITLKVIAVPGHTAGGASFYVEEGHLVFSGDTLFQESVGRTDFPTGSMSMLVRSVKDKLFLLPEDTEVYPGHGDSTTIGHEKQFNPFCQ